MTSMGSPTYLNQYNIMEMLPAEEIVIAFFNGPPMTPSAWQAILSRGEEDRHVLVVQVNLDKTFLRVFVHNILCTFFSIDIDTECNEIVHAGTVLEGKVRMTCVELHMCDIFENCEWLLCLKLH